MLVTFLSFQNDGNVNTKDKIMKADEEEEEDEEQKQEQEQREYDDEDGYEG